MVRRGQTARHVQTGLDHFRPAAASKRRGGDAALHRDSMANPSRPITASANARSAAGRVGRVEPRTPLFRALDMNGSPANHGERYRPHLDGTAEARIRRTPT